LLKYEKGKNMVKGKKLMKCVNEKIATSKFIDNHKENLKDFSRDRVLNFAVVFILILRNTAKSLQLALNELFVKGVLPHTVSASAYTQARKKFKHTAFIELNEDAIEIYYSDNKVKRWKHYRCLGVDASTLILPNTPDVKKDFGEIKIKTQHLDNSSYTCGVFECCYDVLNQIALKSILAPASSYEVDLGIQMLTDPVIQEKDLLIYDRGYASYEFLATLKQLGKNFIVRIPKKSFKETRSLFEGQGHWSQIAKLTPPREKKQTIKAKELPNEIEIRFVSVVLSTGEIEVLATSLMDKSIKREEFKQLYNLRWGVEVFFNLLKGRLGIENFTGKTAESVRQDFWSAIFISNVETVLTEQTEEEINAEVSKNQLYKKVNHAVSFNAIKNMAVDILFKNKNNDQAMEKLLLLFRTGTLVQRKDRSPPREKPSLRRSYNFLRRIKKQVF
jgi:hypothetical protein